MLQKNLDFNEWSIAANHSDFMNNHYHFVNWGCYFILIWLGNPVCWEKDAYLRCNSVLSFPFLFGCFLSGIFGLVTSFLVGMMSISVNSSDRVCENGIQHVELLPATNDVHGGVIVDMKDAMDAQHFLTLLRASISQWRREVLLSIIYFIQCQLVH